MTYCNAFFLKITHNKLLLFSLICLWICGGFWGCYYAGNAVDVFPPLIHILAVRRASFVGMLVSVFLPLLLTILISHFSLFIFLPILSFVKAFAFSFTTYLVFCTFGSSSWLIQILFLFSDSITVILLFYLWILALRRKKIAFPVLFTFFTIIGVVCTIDCFVISPFLISLLHF